MPELSIPCFGELAGGIIAAAAEHEWRVLIEQTQGAPLRDNPASCAQGVSWSVSAAWTP